MNEANRRIGKWLTVSELHPEPGKKTKRWVLQNLDGDQLGDISWYGNWRCYVVEPRPGCVFHDGCLRDIAAFLTSVRNERVAIPKREEIASGCPPVCFDDGCICDRSDD